jgi:hypothetical protein
MQKERFHPKTYHDGEFGVGIVTANLQLHPTRDKRDNGLFCENDLGASGIGPRHATKQKGCQKGIEQHTPNHLTINGANEAGTILKERICSVWKAVSNRRAYR